MLLLSCILRSPLQVALSQAVRHDLSEGLLTCLVVFGQKCTIVGTGAERSSLWRRCRLRRRSPLCFRQMQQGCRCDDLSLSLNVCPFNVMMTWYILYLYYFTLNKSCQSLSLSLSLSLSQWNYDQNTKRFIQENASENIVCEMTANLARGDELMCITLEKVKRPIMYVSRMKSIGFEAFKCLHNSSPSYITDMFRISATPYDTRGGTKSMQPKVNTTRNGLKSFRYQGAKIWNQLPTFIKNTEHVSEFKYRLNEWPGPVCKCGSCDVCKFKII